MIKTVLTKLVFNVVAIVPAVLFVWFIWTLAQVELAKVFSIF